MRADRLISLIMLLQTRGRMPAHRLAAELEVSERTIYRDVDDLSAAGIPIYGETGREGGFALLDSYRTTLTGLSEGEVRALFMLSVPACLDELGVSGDLRAALLKLAASLPTARRHDQQQVRLRFHLDSTWWHQGRQPVPHLQAIHRAVWEDRRLCVVHSPHGLDLEIEQTVDAYGLVAKAGVWYLVFGRLGRTGVLRVSDLSNARLLDETFERPAGFDLAAFWEGWCARREERDSGYPVTARIAPNLIPVLSRHLGRGTSAVLGEAGPPDAEGWVTARMAFDSFEAARERLLSFGGAAEVLRPAALRLSIEDYARQITTLYAGEAA